MKFISRYSRLFISKISLMGSQVFKTNHQNSRARYLNQNLLRSYPNKGSIMQKSRLTKKRRLLII
jgi:hypothetical protein